MATLSFKKINKIYDNNVQAVFDFNLDIKDKEFIVFVGPSGCGKSTTLRMIAGLEDITSGELYIDGELVNNVVPKDRDIAMVFQSYALYPQMTVYQNMEFALKVRKTKMPILDETEADVELKTLMSEKFKEVHRVDKKFMKEQDNKELLDAHIKLYKELFDLKAKYDEKLKPVFGIDVKTIEDSKKTILKLTSEIEDSNKILLKLEKDKEKGKLVPQGTTSYESIKQIVEDAIVQKNHQIEVLKERINYLENNNVQLFENRHLTNFEIAIEINKTALPLDLTRYLFRKPKALSGGQRQRVALGRAIVRKPKVFLMDEPLSNLDAKLRAAMRSEISKIHEQTGGTTIYVTHDQVEAMTMATRIVVMKDGWIQQIGSPDEVYSDPANIFVAGFIGSPSMNFINATVNKDKLVIEHEDKQFNFELSKTQSKLLADYDSKDITIGVRPESIILSEDSKGILTSDVIEQECYYAELLGSELLLHFEFYGKKITAKTSSSHKIKTHDIVKYCFKTEDMYFFDKKTGKRIK